MKFGPAVLVGILIALAGTAVPALAITSISSCPGSSLASGNYQLTADLTNCTISIFASNVSLALNGHSIAGPAFADVINVNAPLAIGRLNHVAIQGPGLISGNGGDIGIAINDTDYSQISQVTIKGSLNFGILGQGSGNTFLTVGSNVLGGRNITFADVFLRLCTSCTVSGNQVSGAQLLAGIDLVGGSANTVNNNTANGNENGIIVDQETGTRVYGNVTNGNARHGIYLPGASSVQVFSNTSSLANGIADMGDDSATCAGNLWGSNVFQTASQTCIH